MVLGLHDLGQIWPKDTNITSGGETFVAEAVWQSIRRQFNGHQKLIEELSPPARAYLHDELGIAPLALVGTAVRPFQQPSLTSIYNSKEYVVSSMILPAFLSLLVLAAMWLSGRASQV